MCRWIAYSGPALRLDTVLLRPHHSLIDQSLRARLNRLPTNADGFGVAWYGDFEEPGLYRDVRPAWNDENLRQVARHVESPLFLAHVRAATGTAVQRSNCHPFLHGRWAFQHNGQIPDFVRVRRALAFDVAPEIFPDLLGTTDSELMFLLAVTLGLAEDPRGALQRMVGRVERACREAGIAKPVHFTAALADGTRLYVVRYSTEGDPATAFLSRDLRCLKDLHGDYDALPPGGLVVVSEPLDDLEDNWKTIPPSSFCTIEGDEVDVVRFEPE